MDRSPIDKIKEHISNSINLKASILENETLLSNIERASALCIQALNGGNKILLAGNGGSASDAQHIAAEFVSRFRCNRRALSALSPVTDTSILTSIGNDYGFENIFRRQLEAFGKKGDIFIGISTSGKSQNVLLAIDYCKHSGIKTIGLSGEGGMMGVDVDCLIKIPSLDTALIQESHIMLGHVICGIVESNFN